MYTIIVLLLKIIFKSAEAVDKIQVELDLPVRYFSYYWVVWFT